MAQHGLLEVAQRGPGSIRARGSALERRGRPRPRPPAAPSGTARACAALAAFAQRLRGDQRLELRPARRQAHRELRVDALLQRVQAQLLAARRPPEQLVVGEGGGPEEPLPSRASASLARPAHRLPALAEQGSKRRCRPARGPPQASPDPRVTIAAPRCPPGGRRERLAQLGYRRAAPPTARRLRIAPRSSSSRSSGTDSPG